jgi:hypothetical protein
MTTDMRTCGSRILSGVWLVISILICFTLHAQSGKGKPPKPPHGECDGNCFSTQVIKAEITGDCCTDYTLRISHDGDCRYDLSHFSVALPCGTVDSLWNSGGWENSVGKDPTTGLFGFKIGNISGFGKTQDSTFTVNVKVCGDSSCLEKINVVAYKAGQCVDYDTLTYAVTGSCEDNGGGDNGGGDNGGGDNGGGDNGGGDNGGDSTSTCSTLAASMRVVNASCFGAQDGELEVNIEDGAGPFTYRWSNGTTDSLAQNLVAGMYSVTITDSNGNVLTLNKEVTQPGAIIISETIFHPSCAGSANGSIDLSVSGGSGSYSYAWSNGATTQDISNLNAGLFTVTITDSSGCSKQLSYMLVNNVRILLNGVVTRPSCGQTNGGINVTVTGGATPYTYLWDNGATTEDLSNIGTGNYRLTVTDANGCKGSSTFVVNQNNTVTVAYAVTPAGCFNESVGAIDLTVTSGTPPYTYAWQHGPTTEDLTGLAGGIYRVTVTDNAGCSVQSAINVPKKSIQVNAEVTNPKCYGDTTGSIVIVPIDGSTAYTYQWSNGQTTNSITNVPLGNYTVTVTDASGCSRTLSYTITAPAALAPVAVVNNNNCGAEGSFSIDLSVTGGKTPYTYLWSTGATTQDLQNLNSGTYIVQVTDANGCVSSKELTVSPAANSFVCTINPPTDPIICNSAGNSLTSIVTDAQSYQWSVSSSDNSWVITNGGSSSAIIFNSGNAGSTATFSLTFQKNGCTRSCSFEIVSGCTVRDNTGGGDPSSSDPCVSDSTAAGVIIEAAQAQPTEIESTPDEEIGFSLEAYPNPFAGKVSFEWTADEDDFARLIIMDQYGKVIAKLFAGQVEKGTKYAVQWEEEGFRDRVYYYQYISSTQRERGKLFKR